jgi:hypothetical protein
VTHTHTHNYSVFSIITVYSYCTISDW